MHDILGEISKFGKVRLTGSQYICNPAPKDSDIDYILLNEDLSAIGYLENQGFFQETGEYEDLENQFYSMRKNNINFIITNNREFFKRHEVASNICKLLNLMNKKDRIKVFQTILYKIDQKLDTSKGVRKCK